MFYDRHVNESQRLKHVASLPSLADDLIRMVDDRYAEIKRNGGPLPARLETLGQLRTIVPQLIEVDPEDEVTPDTMINQFGCSISNTCLPIISNWILHPNAPKYYSTLSFNRQKKSKFLPGRQDDPREDFTIRFAPPDEVHPDVLASADDLVKGALKEWHDRDLGTWVLLPLAPDSEQLLRSLDDLFAVTDLPSPMCHIDGLPIIFDKKPSPFDAEITSWSVLPPDAVRGASEGAPRCNPSSLVNRSNVGIIYPHPFGRNSSQSKFEAVKEPTPEGLVHHVWRLATQKDTTIVVLNCGNYERIGIRHRSSQTLYLSDVIDVTKPGYGKLHLGILMSAVVDALNRYRVYRARNPIPPSIMRTTKRQRKVEIAGNVDLRRSKRQKLNIILEKSRDHQPLNKRDTQTLWREMTRRPILLLQFSGDGLNSSKPACCLRKGSALSPFSPGDVQPLDDLKELYHPDDYFFLTLRWGNLCGVTGHVFTGQLRVTLLDGRSLSRGVVAKIAYYEEARDRIRREYHVYQRLWGHGIKRIPEIYGLFEDADDLATILVMERAACTFREREPTTTENKGGLKEVLLSDKLMVVATVEAIHKAGVVHRDLRPENLAIALDGKPMVIDFDQSIVDPTDQLKILETKRLEDLLSGKTTSTGQPI
ncbi:hypothetical protein BDN72DRAFT_149419 [Pluteus cervinus]|uniref:Uncharacterized protein n=1 Tax=Pluteus cervinus TaxID=181527 RepID=A0ACD3AN86_9AGAR|nr:hypothetical protein BDN72DRAFT_149419 [Pluteus cervinus]